MGITLDAGYQCEGDNMSLESIEAKLDRLIEDSQESPTEITIPFEEYLKIRAVYDRNKDKKYLIELNLYMDTTIEEDGVKTTLSHLHTSSFNFPDDTETKLTELFERVHENVKYMEYLQAKLKAKQEEVWKLEKSLQTSRECLAQVNVQNQKFKQDITDAVYEARKSSVWYRLRCAIANRKL